MTIAISAKGDYHQALVDVRFGRADFFALYEDIGKSFTFVSNREAREQEHGAGPKAAKLLLAQDVQILITGNGPGRNVAGILEKAGIAVYTGAGNLTVTEALDAYEKDALKLFRPV